MWRLSTRDRLPSISLLSRRVIPVNYLVSWATFRSKRLARLVEGHPVILIRDGKIDHRARRSAMLTLEELHAPPGYEPELLKARKIFQIRKLQ